MCARHGAILGGGSPLWALMMGTTSLGKGVRREAESKGSQRRNLDLTNRNWIEGRCPLEKPALDGESDSHLEGGRVNPAEPK